MRLSRQKLDRKVPSALVVVVTHHRNEAAHTLGDFMKRRTWRILIATACFGMMVPSTSHAIGDFGPDTCKEGFVWREACGPGDHVCVTPDIRRQAQQDNSQANGRRQPGGGAFGSDTCRQGFVWREACGPQDNVCVPVSTRTRAADDNRHARERQRRFVVKVCQWRGTAPFCNGDCPNGWSKECHASDDFHARGCIIGQPLSPQAFGNSCATGAKAMCCRFQ
jgi:hypothetical protein